MKEKALLNITTGVKMNNKDMLLTEFKSILDDNYSFDDVDNFPTEYNDLRESEKNVLRRIQVEQSMDYIADLLDDDRESESLITAIYNEQYEDAAEIVTAVIDDSITLKTRFFIDTYEAFLPTERDVIFSDNEE